MTPAEAIQNEIDSERRELEALDEEQARIEREIMEGIEAEEMRPDLLLRAIEILARQMRREEDEEEIRGKEEALQAVQDNPATPVRAIGEIIKAEMRAAKELGRRAQRLREEAWRDEQAGNTDEAERKRGEASRLGQQHKRQLARLRGKHRSTREVERVLRKAR